MAEAVQNLIKGPQEMLANILKMINFDLKIYSLIDSGADLLSQVQNCILLGHLHFARA